VTAKTLQPSWHFLHPFLAGLYPVFYLYAANMDWVPVSTVTWIVALIVATTALLLWLLRFAIPKPGGRALVVTLFYLSFYLLSPYVMILSRPHLAFLPQEITTHIAIVSALSLGVLLVAAILFVRKSGWGFRPATVGLNAFTGVLILFSMGDMVQWYRANVHNQGVQIAQVQAASVATTVVQEPWYETAESLVTDALDQQFVLPEVMPDIYYIILDGYGRADILEDYYDFRDEAFLDYLTERGFYVARRSHSNYAQTYLSLASSLNLNYLDSIQELMGAGSRNRVPLRYLIENNAVVRGLQALGYEYLLLGSNYHATETSPLADRCYCENRSLQEFEQAMLVRTAIGFWLPQRERTKYDEHRDTILRTFYYLQRLPDRNLPKFVFAHLIAPHPPFVFDADGRIRTPDKPFGFEDGSHFMGTRQEYIEGYRGQTAYLNRQLQQTIDSILARSKVPPIIILQADHGPGSRLDWGSVENTDMQERMAIFNAYYFPSGATSELYDSITPVNTFRILFNHYFGAHYEILEDRIYFSLWPRPYDFVEFQPDDFAPPAE
jgi:hypothetical protein